MTTLQKCLWICLFIPFFGFAQNETNNWYFAYHLYLNFNSSVLNLSNGGNTNVREGSAAISDKYGSLLFYTDGKKVWDRNHAMMPNGDSLSTLWGLPYMSTTQPAVIVPFPNDSTLYYLFTVDCIDAGGVPPHKLY